MAANKKHTNNLENEPLDLLDEVKESDYFQWLIEKRQYLPYIFIAVIAVIALLYKVTEGRTTTAETNYMMAENYMAMLQRSLTGEPESGQPLSSLDRLKNITESYPELQSRYDGLLAQLLLMTGDIEEGEEFALRCIQRTSRDDLPVFNDFPKTTLTVANQDFAQGLQESKDLKVRLLEKFKQSSSGASLFAYTLFRIAMLEMKAGTPAGELEAWQDWEKYADQSENPVLTNAFSSLSEQLRDGEFTLNQYIAVRKKEIQEN